MEHLTNARAALRRVDVGAKGYVDASNGRRAAAKSAVTSAQAVLAREIALELATPDYPEERGLGEAVQRLLGGLDAALARMFEAASDDLGGSYATVQDAVDQADDALERLLELNAREAHDEIRQVSAMRRRTSRTALVLDSVCISISILAAVITVRALRRQRALERAYASALAERASELDMFAKRVAHDLLGPLSALSLVVTCIKRSSARNEPLGEMLVRADACLGRTQHLVGGILDFARSGIQSTEEPLADVRDAITGVLDEARADEAAGTEIVVAPFDEIQVKCSPGVLASVVANLVRNAIKYMKGREERRLTVRISPVGQFARVEVEDTGPGLPPGLESSVFDAYVRAPGNTQPGLGLGLATVKRFVESHGGRVGVESTPGRGCVFWFELPRAVPRGEAHASASTLGHASPT